MAAPVLSRAYTNPLFHACTHDEFQRRRLPVAPAYNAFVTELDPVQVYLSTLAIVYFLLVTGRRPAPGAAPSARAIAGVTHIPAASA